MIIDGRSIASEIYGELRNRVSHMITKPHLTVFTCAPNFETKRFLMLKKRRAEEIGLSINVIELPESVTTEEVIVTVQHSFMQTDGVIVQLPFPTHIDVTKVLNTIPQSLDVDVMRYDGSASEILPPVVGAIKEIAERHDILFATQKVVVVGQGNLVGVPSAVWARKQGAQVSVVTEETENSHDVISSADILILGAGKPGLITPDMIKEGVILFDAGTSEEGGLLKGDAHPECAKKASLFTPVPGGIGPITVAVLLRNLIALSDT